MYLQFISLLFLAYCPDVSKYTNEKYQKAYVYLI